MENIFANLGDADLDKVIASYAVDYVDMEFNIRKFRQRIYELAVDEKRKRERSVRRSKTFLECVIDYWEENFVYIEPNEFEDCELPKDVDAFLQKCKDDLAFCVWSITELAQWGMDNECDTIEVQPWWDSYGQYSIENGLTLVRFYDGDFLIDIGTVEYLANLDEIKPKVYECVEREEEVTKSVFNRGDILMF